MNPDAPAFEPSPGYVPFTLVTSKKKSKKSNKTWQPHKPRKNSGELWVQQRGWIPFYRCQACHEVMSKKEDSRCPQRINSCGHITCAKCIVTSYLVDLNPLCPVKDCGKCVDPNQKEKVAPLNILTEDCLSTPSSSPITVQTENMEPMATIPENKEAEFNDEEIDAFAIRGYDPNVCYCGDKECAWDCGELWCGCIDVCRNRCGLNEHIWGRY